MLLGFDSRCNDIGTSEVCAIISSYLINIYSTLRKVYKWLLKLLNSVSAVYIRLKINWGTRLDMARHGAAGAAAVVLTTLS